MLLKKYNPDAASGNTLTFASTGVGCCPDSARPDCQYDATFPTANKLTAITLNTAKGEVVTYPITTYVNNMELAVQLDAIVDRAGYLIDMKDDVELENVSTNTILHLRGELVPVSVTTALPATINFAAGLCNHMTYCTYKLFTEGGTTNTYVYDNVSNALGTLEYGVNTAADVRTAILAVSPTASSVTVTDDVVNQQWNIDIIAPLGTKIYLNTKNAEKCYCKQMYVA